MDHTTLGRIYNRKSMALDFGDDTIRHDSIRFDGSARLSSLPQLILIGEHLQASFSPWNSLDVSWWISMRPPFYCFSLGEFPDALQGQGDLQSFLRIAWSKCLMDIKSDFKSKQSSFKDHWSISKHTGFFKKTNAHEYMVLWSCLRPLPPNSMLGTPGVHDGLQKKQTS